MTDQPDQPDSTAGDHHPTVVRTDPEITASAPPQIPLTPASLPRTAPAHGLPEDVVKRSLRVSVKDGVAWSFMIGFGERYVSPFVILGGSGPFPIAFLAILPAVAGALIMWLAANVTDTLGRRKFIFVLCSHLQSLMWVPMCAAIFLPQPASYITMLLAFIAYVVLHNFSIPAWNSVMGDLVPPEIRGRYFGTRNMLVGLTLIGSFLLGGWWLDFMEFRQGYGLFGLSPKNTGFLVLFALAGVARLFSAHYLSRMTEPPYHRQVSDRFTLWEFIKRAPRADYGRFVIYNALLQLGGGFVGPFFNLYILGHLGFSPWGFAWIGTIHMLVYFSLGTWWGRLADRLGNKRIMTIGGIGITGIPVLLLLSDNFYYLATVQIYDAAVWSAFNIAASNYFFDIVTPAKRARCTAYNSLFVTTGAVLGVLGGAFVMQYVPQPLHLGGLMLSHPFKVILIISTVMRLIPNLLLLHTFREWRLVQPPSEVPIRPEGHGEGAAT